MNYVLNDVTPPPQKKGCIQLDTWLPVWVCVHTEQVFYFEGQDSGDKGPAIDLGDVSSLRHDDRLQLFNWVHGCHHLTPPFRVVAPKTQTQCDK